MRTRQQVLNLLLECPDATYEKIGSMVHCSKQRVHQIAKSAGLARKLRPPYYRSDITVDKVLELYNRDILIKEMAPILGCCRGTITKRLREAGINPLQSFSRSMKLNWRGKYHYRDDITTDRVLNLYNNNLLIEEIAQILGCNNATVRSRLRSAGITKSECYSRSLRIRWERRKKKRKGMKSPFLNLLSHF